MMHRRRGALAGLLAVAIAMTLSGCAPTPVAPLTFYMDDAEGCSWIDYPKSHEHILFDKVTNTTNEDLVIDAATLDLPRGVSLEGVFTGPDSSKLTRVMPLVDADSKREWAKRKDIAGTRLPVGATLTYFYLVKVADDVGRDQFSITHAALALTDPSGKTLTASPRDATWLTHLGKGCQ